MTPSERFQAPRHFAGWITPSSNTVVERVTQAILRDVPEVSAHFSRTSVVGSVDPYPLTYDWDDMLRCAGLLADARLDVVAWNGSKGGSLDFGLDRELVRRIEAATGARSTTSILALDQVLRQDGITRVGLCCPYVASYRDRIVATFERTGYACTAAVTAELSDNHSFSLIPEDTIAGMLRQVAASRPQAIVTFCTNFPAAPLVARMEDELGLPIYDTVALGVWGVLSLLGVDTRRCRAWGSLFER